MKALSKISVLFFIILCLLNFSNTLKEVKIWEDENKVYKDYSFLNINDIDSFALDDSSNTELILANTNNGSYFYLIKDNILYKTVKNTLGISNIQSPLVECNSTYFFCSPSFNQILYIKNDNLKTVILGKDVPNNSYNLKCIKYQKFIGMLFLETHKFYMYSIIENKNKSCTLFSGNFQYKAFNVINIYQNYSLFLVIKFLKKKINSQNIITYSISEIKFNGSKFINNSDIILNNDFFQFYSNIELSILKNKTALILTYESNNNYRFYHMNYSTGEIIFNSGSNFLGFLNGYKIKSTGFIGNTPLLYYNIKNLAHPINNYIGVADLQYSLVIYNIKVDVSEKKFKEYGFINNNTFYLNYINDTQQVRYCPFIKEEDSCRYYKSHDNENYFSISRIGSKYNNSFAEKCDGKSLDNYYCLEECPTGYSFLESLDNNTCINCFDNPEKKYNFYNYESKICSQACDNYPHNSKICYDCKGENPFYYEFDCVKTCEDMYGEVVNGTCISCKDKNMVYYKNYDIVEKGKCINKEDCKGDRIINTYSNECSQCYIQELFYFPLIEECISECPDYFIQNKTKNECQLCSENLKFENNKCVSNCSIDSDDYGINIINLQEKYNLKDEKNILYCGKCNNFKEEDKCVELCSFRYIINEKKCEYCPDDKYYIENVFYNCTDNCPEFTVKDDDHKTCRYCEQLYYKDNKCVDDCTKYYLINTTQESFINYCLECGNNKTFRNGQCIDGCDINSYLNLNRICKDCSCGSPYDSCYDSEKYPLGQCNCYDKNHTYGFSCEFYCEENINNIELQIIAINNKLYQTKRTYFTYILNNIQKNTNNKNYKFTWKVFLDEEEITGQKINEKYFSTSQNESIFGINKELLQYAKLNNKKINISLNINDFENQKNYSNKITLILINYTNIDNTYFNLEYEGNLYFYEMKTLLYLKKKKNIEDKIQYYFQYELMDYYNEKFPINQYSEFKEVKFFSPYLNSFYINIKNDRDEQSSISLSVKDTYPSKEIDNLNDFSETEKLYALITNLRLKKYSNQNDTQISYIDDFINKSIQYIINEKGYFLENYTINNETSNNDRNIIVYSEPKIIFSLINYFLISQKNCLTKSGIMKFFNYFDEIFKKVFHNNIISNKTLSSSDIKSLFRTLDNLYDTVVRINNETSNKNDDEFIDKDYFIEILNNICKYLSYTTYPSETIKLVGKRISLISFHLGDHQTTISFPFMNDIGNITINNYSTYSYDNYYLNKKNCSQKYSTFFCLTEDNFEKLKYKLISNNYSLNNIIFNIYLLQDISKENEEEIIDIDEKGHSSSEDNINYIIKF